jgi:membrane protease YdiL (CAAX protease family)
VAAGLLACAAALVAGLREHHAAPWEETAAGAMQVTLPADLLYRLSLSIADLPAGRLQAKGLWWTRELATAMYERLGYQAVGTGPVRAKLAMIYGAGGHRAEASALLALVPRDAPELVRAAVLLDWLYGTGRRPPGAPEAMADLQEQFEPWVARAVLIRVAKENGDTAEAARLERSDREVRVTFLRALMAQAAVGAALLALGIVMLAMWFWRWLRRPTPLVRVRPAPLLKPWRPMDAVEVWAVLLVVVAAAQGLAILLRSRGLGEMGQLGVHALGYALAALLPLWVIARKTRGQTPGGATLVGIAPVRIGGLAGGVLAYAVFLAALALTAGAASWFFGFNLSMGALLAQTGAGAHFRQPLSGAMYGVLAVLVAPVVEETIFRGFVYSGLRRTMPVGMATILSAIMFATAHVGVSGAAVMGIGVLALGLAYTYERTRNLWICIGMHMIHNALVFALMALAAL